MRETVLVGILGLQVAAAVAAQPARSGAGRESVIGELTTVATAERRLVVRKDGDVEIAVSYDERTAFLRAQPGATTLEGATAVSPPDLTAGDRLLCRGSLSADGRTLSANRVVVMTRGDLEARRAREREDWRRRGLAGAVAALDPARQEITVRVPHGGVVRSVVVEAGNPAVVFRRYSPGSVRFSDTRPGVFSDLAVGDQVRVLGNTRPGEERVVAEQIVSGVFHIVRGVVTSVDADKRTIDIRENGRGGGLVPVAVGTDALLRRLPPMMVARLTRAAEGGGAGVPGNGSTGRGSDPDEVLEQLPPATMLDVKKGDEIAVLGPKRSGEAALPAIKLAVWTAEATPAARGGRGRGMGGEGQSSDAFSDLLGMGGESPW